MSIMIFDALMFISINSFLIEVFPSSISSATTDQNNSKSINGNESMMPGKNMTFGVSLENAKMHLMEAIMDLKEDNINGALMQLNMTTNDIKMHEKEMADMMLMIKKMK